MVEWLEQHGYDAESSQKVVVQIWASPAQNWKTLPFNLQQMGTYFETGKDKAAKGKG